MKRIKSKRLSRIATLSICLAALVFCSCSSARRAGTNQRHKYHSFTFVQLSDPQLGFLNGNMNYAEDSVLLSRVIRKVNSLKPSFVIMTGDMTNASGNASQIGCYKKVVSTLRKSIPLYQIPGNHDVGKGSTDEKIAKYISNYGPDHFSFDYEGCHFVGINSCVIKDANKSLEDRQWDWLAKDLDSKKGSRLSFVICHHSFFLRSYTEKVSYSNQAQDVRDKYWELFKKNGVDCVISGHLHDNVCSEHDGIEMVTTGPVGKPLGKGYSGVCVWSVDENGTYSHQYYSIDEFEKIGRL